MIYNEISYNAFRLIFVSYPNTSFALRLIREPYGTPFCWCYQISSWIWSRNEDRAIIDGEWTNKSPDIIGKHETGMRGNRFGYTHTTNVTMCSRSLRRERETRRRVSSIALCDLSPAYMREQHDRFIQPVGSYSEHCLQTDSQYISLGRLSETAVPAQTSTNAWP